MLAREIFALFDGAGDAAFAVDLDGSICYWSPNAEKLLGYSEVEIATKHCADILAGEDQAGCAICGYGCGILERARAGDRVNSYELHARTAAGDRKWLSVSIIVAHPSDRGSPIVVHLMRDLEHQKQIEGFTRNILVEVGRLTGRQADEIVHNASSPPPTVDLTERELAILRLLSLGRATQQIAAELYISAATVRTHVQHILGKLRCHSRLEAVLYAVRQGLI